MERVILRSEPVTDLKWVFLIGAARSGTKFLRDTLASSEAVACIPYDVGYVWRTGQEGLPHDELTVASATPARVARIRKTLTRLAEKNGAVNGQVVIEKTVGNTLRVDFIRACFPEARFIYLERDALDVVASAYGQWTAPVDRRYLIDKLRYFPVTSWRYGLWFVRNQLRPTDSAPIWGPRFKGIQSVLQSEGIVSAVTKQYVACVQSARGLMTASDAFAVRYSDLGARDQRWHELLTWLGVDDAAAVDQFIAANFRVGAGWPGTLTADQQTEVREILATHLADGS